MKNWFRVIICVMLMVSILAMSLSVFAVDYSDRVKAKEYLVAYYIWKFLNAIGIDVTYLDILEYNDYIQDTIIDWVVNYIADMIEADSMPSNYTIAEWIAPWQVGYDYWGNLQYNDTMLEDMQDFAQWLKQKFSLIDDDTIVINPVKQVGEYQLCDFNTFYQGQYRYPLEYDHGTYYNYIAQEVNGNSSGFLGWIQVEIQDGASSYYMVYIIGALNAGTGRVERVMMKQDYSEYQASGVNFGSPWGVAGNNIRYKYEPYMEQYLTGSAYPNSRNDFIINGNHMRGTRSEIEAYLNMANIEYVGNIKVLTREITMPVDNPDYTEGDGITIIDGEPNYELITFSGEITNLPAVVSTGTIENPHLEEAYRPIQGLITYAKDGISVCTALLYELPDEMVYMWYGLIASIIIWGMIKVMREH